MDEKQSDLKKRIYQSYTSSFLESIRDISLESFEKQRIFYKAYFGRFLLGDKEAKILEIGCGYGPFLYFLQKEGYKNVIGIDISPEQVETAKKLGMTNVISDDNIDFLKKHLGEYDLIVAIDVIEHYSKEELFELLDAIYSALRDGGRFVLQTPNADGPFGGRYRYWEFTHELAFTKPSITQVLKVVGFNEVEVYPAEPVVHGVKSGLRWVLWKVIRQLLVFYLVVETGGFKDHILTQNLIAVGRK